VGAGTNESLFENLPYNRDHTCWPEWSPGWITVKFVNGAATVDEKLGAWLIAIGYCATESAPDQLLFGLV
jgi:hypothetical protein